MEEEKLFPVEKDMGVWQTTLDELLIRMRWERMTFHGVRLVNPSSMRVVTVKDGKLVDTVEVCHHIWRGQKRCVNCISAKALTSSRTLYKFEFVDDNAYLVDALPVEVDGQVYVLERVLQLDNVLLSAFGKNRFRRQIEQYNDKVYRDSLTGAFNRRYYDEIARGLYCNGVAMIDSDHFKAINDRHGHQTGDLVLQKIAEVIQKNIRTTDCLIRYGGDEFVLYFYGFHNLHDFEAKLTRIRELIRTIKIDSAPDLQVGVSIGGVFATEPLEDVLGIADMSMYEAKKSENGIVIRDLTQ